MQHQEPGQWLNPNVGWVIGPIAMATGWVESQVAVVDLSWAELLYSVAAVLYAIAAVIKSVREKKQLIQPQKSESKTITPPWDDPRAEDTIDLK